MDSKVLNRAMKSKFEGETMREFVIYFNRLGNNVFATLCDEYMLDGYSRLQASEKACEVMNIPIMFWNQYSRNKKKLLKRYKF